MPFRADAGCLAGRETINCCYQQCGGGRAMKVLSFHSVIPKMDDNQAGFVTGLWWSSISGASLHCLAIQLDGRRNTLFREHDNREPVTLYSGVFQVASELRSAVPRAIGLRE
jgi:hypothetical protein